MTDTVETQTAAANLDNKARQRNSSLKATLASDALVELPAPMRNGVRTNHWTKFLKARCKATHAHGGATDLILCTFCFLLAHRLYLGEFGLTSERLVVFIVSPFLVLLWLATSGAISTNKLISLGEAVTRVAIAWTLALMSVGLFVYFTKLAEPVSRGWIGISMVSSLFVLLTARVAHFGISSVLFGNDHTSIIIVGSAEKSNALALRASRNERENIDVQAIFTHRNENTLGITDESLADPVLNFIEERRRYSDPIHQVWISPPADNLNYFASLKDRLLNSSADVCIVLNDYEVQLISGSRRALGRTEIVNISDVRLPPHAETTKRFFDYLLTSVGLLLLSPVMLIIAAIILIDSRGPVLFKQKRFGLDGREIEVWKFRTMFHTAIESTTVDQATRNDTRITRIGSFLRRTSLDELPQLFNVLQGHMSLVGPRPHAVEHSHKYRELVPGYMLRHKIKPGITGWAQIHGWRGETDTLDKMQNRIKFDVAYIRNWSLWLDIQIVARTALTVLFDKNAY